MKKWILSVCILTPLIAGAQNKKAHRHEHREHGAHVHGSAKLSIAFDKNKGKIEFKTPGESLFGFEYKAKTAADKKFQSETIYQDDKSLIYESEGE